MADAEPTEHLPDTAGNRTDVVGDPVRGVIGARAGASFMPPAVSFMPPGVSFMARDPHSRGEDIARPGTGRRSRNAQFTATFAGR
ncbi:hypothetical protein JCM4914_12940 [Streptomyces platensis subsp. malvinus]